MAEGSKGYQLGVLIGNLLKRSAERTERADYERAADAKPPVALSLNMSDGMKLDLPTPQVNVDSALIAEAIERGLNRIAEAIAAKDVTVNVPQQPPAEVTVNVPKQEPAKVTVNVPEQKPPVVNVQVPEEKPLNLRIEERNGKPLRIVEE